MPSNWAEKNAVYKLIISINKYKQGHFCQQIVYRIVRRFVRKIARVDGPLGSLGMLGEKEWEEEWKDREG
jgi:hypothetical protein